MPSLSDIEAMDRDYFNINSADEYFGRSGETVMNLIKEFESEYKAARAAGTPDFVSDGGIELDAALEEWGDGLVMDVVNDGTDDFYAVAYMDNGNWCAYRVKGEA